MSVQLCIHVTVAPPSQFIVVLFGTFVFYIIVVSVILFVVLFAADMNRMMMHHCQLNFKKLHV